MRTLSQQRRDQSLTDELTKLRNRRYLTTVLDGYFAELEAGFVFQEAEAIDEFGEMCLVDFDPASADQGEAVSGFEEFVDFILG